MKFSEWLRGPVPRKKFRDPVPVGDWVINSLTAFIICFWIGYASAAAIFRNLPRILHFFLP